MKTTCDGVSFRNCAERKAPQGLLPLLAPCLLFASFSVLAATHCVCSGVAHNGDGSTWSAAASNGAPGAFRGLPVTLIRGDVYYLAAGTYAGRTFTEAGTNLISLVKATEGAHGPATGWQSDYSTGAAVFTNGFTFAGVGNCLVDGVTGSGRADYGFEFRGGNAIALQHGAGQVNVRHCNIFQYPEGTSKTNMTASARLVTVWNGTAARSGPLTMSSCWLHHVFGCQFLFRSGQGITIEKCVIEKNRSTAAEHAEGISDDQSHDVIIRWNEWYAIGGTAYIAGINGAVGSTMNHWDIYGNVFWSDGSWCDAPPIITVINDANNHSSASNWRIVNNTISSHIGGGSMVFNLHTNVVAYNNYVYAPRSQDGWTTANKGFISTGFFGLDSQDYNFWSGTIHFWGQKSGPHEPRIVDRSSCCSAPIEGAPPFVNWQAGNFHLTATARGIGTATNLGAPFDVDKDGIRRSNRWDVGAYQFTGAVSNLTATSGPQMVR